MLASHVIRKAACEWGAQGGADRRQRCGGEQSLGWSCAFGSEVRKCSEDDKHMAQRKLRKGMVVCLALCNGIVLSEDRVLRAQLKLSYEADIRLGNVMDQA